MIVFFKVKNFKSIKDTLEISFLASSISEHADSNVIQKGKDKLLRSLMLYGHNASGKSNILDSIAFFRWFIANSTTELQSNDEIEVEPFKLSQETENAPSFFEMCFYLGNIKYRYGFEATEERVVKEWLLESKKIQEYPVFLRIKDEYQIDEKRIPGATGVEKRTRKNALFLSACSQWNVKKAEKIYNWFDNMYAAHGLMDSGYRELTLDMIRDKSKSILVNRFLKKADLGINNIEVLDIKLEDIIDFVPDDLKEEYKEKFDDSNNKAVLTFHDKYDKKGKKIGVEKFLMDKYESEGTKKFFNLIGVFIDSIFNDRFLIIDEFDARLHTILTKSILRLFNSPKINTESQLLVASHDTALLDRNILRRDQICFVEKNKIGGSELISLVEYKPRKESPYDKNYLDGKYGGIPIIEDLEELF